MCELPTIKVKHKEYKYEMIINESDFDPKVHEKVNTKGSASKKEGETPKDDEKGSASKKEVETPKNDEEELKKLIGA